MTDNPGVEEAGPDVEDRIRIPVDGPAREDTKIDAMVRDYEAKYSAFRDGESPKIKNSARSPFRGSESRT